MGQGLLETVFCWFSARNLDTIDFDSGQYGLAILSRFPISDISNTPLKTQPRSEPRIALSARLKLDAGPRQAVFIDTHLCHRNEQVRTMQTTIFVVANRARNRQNTAGNSHSTPASIRRMITPAMKGTSRCISTRGDNSLKQQVLQ